jgi:diguanylate cyclase (GGDEF)-like protein
MSYIMQSGRLLFLDDGNTLGTKVITASLVPLSDRVTNLVDFLDALQSSHYEIALIRTDRTQLFGKNGETFRRQLIDSARQYDVMTVVMVQTMNTVDCDKLILDGFDDVQHEPYYVSQFEAQLQSIRRISMMRRELNRRQSALKKFLMIVKDVDLDLYFSQDESEIGLYNVEIVLLDLDSEKSGATLVYPQLRRYHCVNYYDDLEQAQARIFSGQTELLVINAAGKAEGALGMIANMRASATFYNYPILLVVQSQESPAPEQVFAAGASDYIEGEISMEAVLLRMKSLLRHEQLRHRLATLCKSPTEAIVHDNLTGFYTYGFARAYLQQFEESMKEHDLSLTAAAISFDNIKRINNEFGFAAGDSIIRQAAEIVRNCVRGEDFVARIAGGKFLLLFPESELKQARFAMNRINNILQYSTLTLPYAEDNLQVATSFNIMQWTPGDMLESLVFIENKIKSRAA